MKPVFALHRGRPLSAEEERTGFSQGPSYDELAVNLADFIESECKKQSCGAGGVLALCGEWGSGKTSFIIRSIYELTRRPGWKEPGVFATKNCSIQCTNERILYFDPWMFTSREELVLQLFKGLCEKFPERENRELRAHLIRYGQLILETLPDLLGIVEAVSARSLSKAISSLSLIPDKIKGVAGSKARMADAWSTESLGKAKQELSKCLEDAKPRLVVIDNVDRLSDDEIRDVFRFIGAVMNLPNIVYLVAFDRNIVSKALEGLQHGGRERFLDKIISAYYFLPKTALWDDVSAFFSTFFPGWKERFGENHDGYVRALAEVLGTHREFNKIKLQFNSLLFLENKGGEIEEFLGECLREVSYETYGRFSSLSPDGRDALIGYAAGAITKLGSRDKVFNDQNAVHEIERYLEGCCFAYDKDSVAGFIETLIHLDFGRVELIGKDRAGWGSSSNAEIRVWTVFRLLGALQTNGSQDNDSNYSVRSGQDAGRSTGHYVDDGSTGENTIEEDFKAERRMNTLSAGYKPFFVTEFEINQNWNR